MKKFILIFIVNIFILSFVIFSFNFLFYAADYYIENKVSLKELFNSYMQFITRDISNQDTEERLITNDSYFRKIENINSNTAPIVLFGCSFTYGTGLEDDETFSYKLGELSGRPVYNRAQGGLGVQHMLYQLKNNKFYSIIKKEPEYVIYVFFNGHYSRMTDPACVYFPFCYTCYYKLNRNNEFILKKRTVISDKIFIHHQIRLYLKNKKFISNLFIKKDEQMLIKYIKASQDEIKKHWKNTKFVVFFFSEPYFEDTYKILEDYGIITITHKDLGFDPSDCGKNKEFCLKDSHTSAIVWEKVTPLIVEKLHLN